LLEERTVDLPFRFDKVWDTARIVFEQSQWSIIKADKAAGRYEVAVSLRLGQDHLLPFLEKLRVDLIRIDENSTSVKVAIKAHQLHWGTTRSHVDVFLIELRRILGLATG
jgi:hypothetical protein